MAKLLNTLKILIKFPLQTGFFAFVILTSILLIILSVLGMN